MLATGNSATAAVQRIKDAGATRIKFVCLLAAPEGIATFTAAHPDVPVFTAAIDRQLNDHGYIMPGLGDAGDRMYGNKSRPPSLRGPRPRAAPPPRPGWARKSVG